MTTVRVRADCPPIWQCARPSCLSACQRHRTAARTKRARKSCLITVWWGPHTRVLSHASHPRTVPAAKARLTRRSGSGPASRDRAAEETDASRWGPGLAFLIKPSHKLRYDQLEFAAEPLHRCTCICGELAYGGTRPTPSPLVGRHISESRARSAVKPHYRPPGTALSPCFTTSHPYNSPCMHPSSSKLLAIGYMHSISILGAVLSP